MMTGIGYGETPRARAPLDEAPHADEVTGPMKLQEGKMGYILLWLQGVSIPILLVIFLLRGCD